MSLLGKASERLDGLQRVALDDEATAGHPPSVVLSSPWSVDTRSTSAVESVGT